LRHKKITIHGLGGVVVAPMRVIFWCAIRVSQMMFSHWKELPPRRVMLSSSSTLFAVLNNKLLNKERRLENLPFANQK
jgi:hypothetical protein